MPCLIYRAVVAGALVLGGAGCTPDAGAPSGGDVSVSDGAAGGSAAARDGGAIAVDPPSAFDAGAPDASASSDAGTGVASAAADAAGVDASGADASAAVPTPSAGCGKSARPPGGRVSVAGARNYIFPPAYDGTRPFPLLIGFHAANNPIDQVETLTDGSGFETDFVRAFPKSKGSAWSYDADIADVIAMYDDLLARYCIDTRRIFATGHSSGAQMLVQILLPAHSAHADHLGFKAIAPVAASRYGKVGRAITVLYVQGAHDSVRGSDGADVVHELAQANGCTDVATPYAGPPCTSAGKPVTDGCVRYEGCSAATAWCSHDDPSYGGTNHGWPCFATEAMLAFFGGLR